MKPLREVLVTRAANCLQATRPVNYPLETDVVDIHKSSAIHTSSSDDTDEG